MTTLQQWAESDTAPWTKSNENDDAVSAAAIFAKKATTTSGLTWGYYGGLYNGNTIADGTVTLTNAADNYIVVLRSTGVVSTSTTSTNSLDPLYAKLYKVTTAASAVTTIVDQRWDANGLHYVTAPGVAGSGDMVLASVQTVTGKKTFGSAGAVGKLAIAGTTSGSTILDAAAVAGSGTVTLPTTGTLATLDGTETLTNKTLTAPALGTPASGTLTNCTGLPSSGITSLPVLIQIAASDETTALTAGTAKVTFRAPYAFTLTDVRGSVTTAPTGATLLTVDVNEAGVSVLSTKLTFDASEKTTTTAATPRVISDSAIADDAEITIDIDAVGSTIAGAGLKVTLIGTKP